MTNTPASSDGIREAARLRLTAQADLAKYLGVWLGVSALLVGIWAATSLTTGHPLYFWPAWPIAGMGIAAVVKGYGAYGPARRGITESDIDAEVQRMQGSGRPF